MNPIRTLIVAGLFAGTTAVAIAAAPRPHVFDPPTSAQLGLSGASATRWDDLREQTLHLREDAQGNAEQELQKLRGLLASDAPDLEAFNRQAERHVDDYLQRARSLKAQKLAFYASLSPSQQKQARSVMLDRLDRLQRLRAALTDLNGATP